MKKIEGGYILIARKKRLESDLMDKPPLYTKLWDWMLMKAFWKDGKSLKRGQFCTSISEMQEAMSYLVGYRKKVPSKGEIRSAYEHFAKSTMISTTKRTHGMIITVTNFEYYQNPDNYEEHTETSANTQRGAQSQHNIDEEGYKKEKKENINNLPPEKPSGESERYKSGSKNRTMEDLRKRYPNQFLLESVFSALASTRKTNSISTSILIAELEKWEKYPVNHVENCLQLYINSKYALSGKKEEYLLGIIRNEKKDTYQTQNIKPLKPHYTTPEDIEKQNNEVGYIPESWRKNA